MADMKVSVGGINGVKAKYFMPEFITMPLAHIADFKYGKCVWFYDLKCAEIVLISKSGHAI